MKIFSTAILCFSMFLSFASKGQEFGKASYIDLAYQGGKTASGEKYDGNKFTAAHKLHPFGTRLKITRQDNGRSVVVRVNDRGPHIKGRIVDLSYAAAKALDMIRDGVINVSVEVVSKGTGTSSEAAPTATQQATPPPSTDLRNATASNTNSQTSSSAEERSQTTPTNYGNNSNNNTTNTTPSNTGASSTGNQNTPPVTKNNQAADYGERLLKEPYKKFGLYEIKILQVNKAGYGVQIASLSSYENAMKQLTQLQSKNVNNALLSIEPKEFGGMAFKVIVGPYENRDDAKKQAARLKRLLKVNGFVVDLGTISY